MCSQVIVVNTGAQKIVEPCCIQPVALLDTTADLDACRNVQLRDEHAR